MTAFELIESQTRPEPGDPIYCQCAPTTTRTVLLDIDEGHVTGVSCTICQRSLDFSDGMGGVYANDVPMTMTTTVEKAQADSFSGYEIAAIWHELTPSAGGEAT